MSSCTYSYTSKQITCPYHDCEKPIGGAVNARYGQVCPYCGRLYTVEVEAYTTTTVHIQGNPSDGRKGGEMTCSCNAPDCTRCHPDAADWHFCFICSEPVRKWQADRQSGMCHDCYEQTMEET